MEKEKNHYKILGVKKDADSDEIKHAYRSAAIKHHPDSDSGDSDSFRRVQEAYEVLSDAERRSAYDRGRENSRLFDRGPQNTSHPGPPVWLENDASHPRDMFFGHGLFDALFDSFFCEPAGGASFRKESYAIDVVLSTEEAAYGGEIPIRIPATIECPRCGGWGCRRCGRSGQIEEIQEIRLRFPAGVQNGQEASLFLQSAGLAGSVLNVTFVVQEL